MIDVAHRCFSGRRCRNAVRDDTTGKREPAVIDKPAGFCDGCRMRVLRAYEAVSLDYQQLCDMVGDKTQGSGPRVSGTREAPMPLNGTVLALRSTLSEFCEVSVCLVAGKLRIAPRARHRGIGYPVHDEPCIHQCRDIIPANLDLLLDAGEQEFQVWDNTGTVYQTGKYDGLTAATLLLRTHQQIENLLGTGERRTTLAMPCPVHDCGSKTLGVTNGETDVSCLACGGRWTDREYQWLASMLVIDIEQQEETEVLQWLLAEARWINDRNMHKISKLETLSRLDNEFLSDIDSTTLIAMLKEILQ